MFWTMESCGFRGQILVGCFDFLFAFVFCEGCDFVLACFCILVLFVDVCGCGFSECAVFDCLFNILLYN